jgi:hypothetical protein
LTKREVATRVNVEWQCGAIKIDIAAPFEGFNEKIVEYLELNED